MNPATADLRLPTDCCPNCKSPLDPVAMAARPSCVAVYFCGSFIIAKTNEFFRSVKCMDSMQDATTPAAVDGLLTARQTTHGDYTDTSLFAQTIKNMCRGSGNWKHLSLPQQESLDLIATKIARILSGNPHEVDHWKDIAGYAELVVIELENQNPKLAGEQK